MIASFAAIQEGFFIFRFRLPAEMNEFLNTLSEIGAEYLFTIDFLWESVKFSWFVMRGYINEKYSR